MDEKIDFLFFHVFFTQANSSEIESRFCIDSSFAPIFEEGETFTHLHDAISVSNNKILVSGRFRKVDGREIESLVRFADDGSIDETFVSQIDFGSFPNFDDLAEQSDGKILVGGNFKIGDSPIELADQSIRLVRMNADGSYDSSFNFSQDVDRGRVRSIKVLSDGKILAGGSLWLKNGEKRLIVRLNSDGSVDETFIGGTAVPIYSRGNVSTISVQEDGKIILGGSFAEFNGVEAFDIVRLNPDGSTDSTFQATTSNIFVGHSSVTKTGSILIGGNFTRVNGEPKRYFARLLSDGIVDPTFATVVNLVVWSTYELSDGRLLVNGSFNMVNGEPIKNIVLLEENGEVDPSFDIDFGNRFVHSFIASQQNGGIILGASVVGQRDKQQLVRLRADCKLGIHIPGINLLLLDD